MMMTSTATTPMNRADAESMCKSMYKSLYKSLYTPMRELMRKSINAARAVGIQCQPKPILVS